MPNLKVDAVALMGVPISNVTMDEVIEFIDASIQEGGFHQIATANVDFVKNAIDDPELQQILCDCDLVVPDGMPLLWVSKLLDCPLRERVSGADLVPRLAELSVQRGYGIYLLGARELVSRQALKNLLTIYPGINICGRYSPPVSSLEDMDHEDILRRIEEARPHILLVAFGNPKQEKWIAMHRDRLKVPVCVGVGASLDFIAGVVPRAPEWMRTAGLEWFYRCSQEPRRLAKRYLLNAAALVKHVPQQFVPHVLQLRRGSDSQVFAQSTEDSIVISVHGSLRGKSLREFVALASFAVNTGMNIVLNMSSVTFLGIDTLGELIRLHSQLAPVQYLWIAGLSRSQVRVLQGARLDARFMTVSSVHDAMNRATRAQQRSFIATMRPLAYGEMPLGGVQVKLVRLYEMCRKVAAPNQRFQEGLAILPVRSAVERVA